MKDRALFQQGQNELDDGSPFRALQDFLRLREEKIDLIHSWNAGSGIRTLRLRDVDQSAMMELAAVTDAGRFSVYSLAANPGKMISLDEVICRNFRFVPYEGKEAIVVVSEQDQTTGLSLYTFQHDRAKLSLNKAQDLRPQISGAQVLDIALKQNKIYVAASDGNIYPYNGVTFQQEKPLDVGEVVRRLSAGSSSGAQSQRHAAKHGLLGVLEHGGLLPFDVSFGRLKKGDIVFGRETVYQDAFIGDPDNDGIDDIIAFTRDGRLHIYDFDTARVKYSASVPDELYAMYCNDVDGDGLLEILLGARGNCIYAFVVDRERNLRVKTEYEMEHRVHELWAGDVQKNTDKKLIVGLANGMLQVFDICPSQEINRGVADAFKKFRSGKHREELVDELTKSDRPEVIRFGLDGLTAEMNPQEVIAFLKRIEEGSGYEGILEVLDKVRLAAGKLVANPDVMTYFVGFLERVFERYPVLPACERLCSTVDGLLKGPGAGSQELIRVAERFNRERLRRSTLQPHRAKLIEELVEKGKRDLAFQELETLKLLGVDLLWMGRTSECVASIVSRNGGRRIHTISHRAFTTFERDQDEPHNMRTFAREELHLSPIPDALDAYVLGHGAQLEMFANGQNTPLATYPHDISCIAARRYRGELCVAVGLDSGEIVVRTSDGRVGTYQVPTCPVGIAAQEEHGLVLFVLTIEGRIYRVCDALKEAKGVPGVQRRDGDVVLEVMFAEPFNALDWVVADGGNAEEALFVVLSPVSVGVVRRVGSRLETSVHTMRKPLTCIAFDDYREAKGRGIVVGTRRRSVMFVSFDGQIRQEIYLPDIPTALQVVPTGKRCRDMLVGFAQGNVSRFRLLDQDDFVELEKRCRSEKENEYQIRWSRHTLREKLVLLGLSDGKPRGITGIHEALDMRIATLIPKRELVHGVKLLEDNRLIHGGVAGAETRYSFADEDYAEWIRNHKELFQTARDHLPELIVAMPLADVARIDAELRKRGEIAWLLEFLLIDGPKWISLVRFSGFLRRLAELENISSGVVVAEKESLRQIAMEFLCTEVQAAFTKQVSLSDEYRRHLAAFEIQVPAVKFLGFDRILTILLMPLEHADFGVILPRIKEFTDWQLVVVLSTGGKDLLRTALKAESFSIAVLDHCDVKAILLADSPREKFLDVLIQQINITALSPFRIAGPVTNMFYGRDNECKTVFNSILQRGAKSFAVIGPRRIGKTSLLWRVRRDVEKHKGFRTVFLDSSVYGDDILRWCDAILAKLEMVEPCRDVGQFIASVNTYCRDNRCRLVLFIDEVDLLLEADPNRPHVFCNTLRALLNEVDVKLVVAGYRELFGQMHDDRSPLFNLLERLELSALEEKDALALITEPLSNVFHIKRQDADYIAEKCGYYPNFIQFCCSRLVANANVRERRNIRRIDIDEVLRSTELYDHIVADYLQNLNEQSQVLLYLMVSHFDERLGKIITDREAHRRAMTSQYAGEQRKYELGARFTPYELHQLLESHKVGLTDQELRGLMRKLVLATVLRHEAGSAAYAFTLSELPAILRRHMEVELAAVNLLERAEEIFRPGTVP